MPRPRQKILDNLESIYREAYDRASAAGDQLRLAVLLAVRDARTAPPPAAPSGQGGADPMSALETIHRIAKLR
jgi:hypothetical protein